MCRGCGKVKYVPPDIVPESTVEESYRTDEEVLIVYNGDGTLRVTGCKSGMLYLFAPGALRRIDRYDAGCLIDTGAFSYG